MRKTSRFVLLNRRLSSKPPSFDLLHKYKENVAVGKLRYDEKQFKVLNLFVKLKTHLEEQNRHMKGITLNAEVSKIKMDNPQLPKRLRGVYLHGQVGTGKTMLMDMFFNSVNLPANKKKRVHFHDFMLEVHQRIHNHKQFLLQTKGRNIHLDPKQCSITYVAQTIVDEAQVLCFDEFQVTDICDAMILNKLFSLLWKSNTILIATSNRPPSDLYQNGLNRQYFLPFIDALSSECVVRDMNSTVDYRQTMSGQKPFNVPNNGEMREKIWSEFLLDVQTVALAEKELENKTISVPGAVTIPVMMGRTLTVPHGYLPPVVVGEKTQRKGVAWMDFNALCCTDKGAADYSSLTAHFHTLYLFGVPKLSVLLHNEARRFITLVDEAYNAHVRLIWTADLPPIDLFEILSADRVKEQQGQGTAFGTDHNWSGGDSKNSDESNSLHSSGDSGDSGDGGGDKKERNYEIHSARGSANTVMSKHFSHSQQTSFEIHTARGSTDTVLSKHSRNSEQLNISISSPSVDAAQDAFKVLEGELASIQDLSFAFQRAASRLTEMNSTEYEDKWREIYYGVAK